MDIINNLLGCRPIIGNNTQIGSFSKIFEKVRIGENVFIGADCTITEDVPSNSRIIKKQANQDNSILAEVLL